MPSFDRRSGFRAWMRCRSVFFGGDLAPNLAVRRYRCASFDPHLRSRRGDVTSVARSSVACRGERRAHTLRCVSGLSPSAEPPPTPNRSPPSRTAPDPMLLWATTALPISAATFDARARSRAVDPLQREAVASVRLDEEPCRLSVPSARPSRGASAPFGAVGAGLWPSPGEERSPRLATWAARVRTHRVKEVLDGRCRRGDLPLLVRRSQHPRVTGDR